MIGRRAELTLGFVLGLAAVATGFLAWGQYTGQVALFGSSVLTSADVAPLPIASTVPTALAKNAHRFTESFTSTTFFDANTSAASWNSEAGELSLQLGFTSGYAISQAVATDTGSVTVTLDAVTTKPAGSAIYYAISHDAGHAWQPLQPGQALTIADAKGDWRWRATLDRGSASINPTIKELSIEFSR